MIEVGAVAVLASVGLRWQWVGCCREFSVVGVPNRRQAYVFYGGLLAVIGLGSVLPVSAVEKVAYSLFLVQLWLLMCFDGWYGYLPDKLSYALLWSGLLWQAGYAPWLVENSVWGAALGYGLPWAVSRVFSLWHGKEGLGLGDAKLLAGIGAWLGVMAVPYVLFVASALALCYAMWQRCRRSCWPSMLYFGPFLGLAAGIMWSVQMGR